MFEAVRPVAPPSAVAADDDLDRIEQTFACRLPADYRRFMKTFGPGTLNGYLDILSPERVIDETVQMRDIYKEEMDADTEGSAASPHNLFFFHIYDNAEASFQPADIDRFICIASSSVGDAHFILPGDPPRYFEVPRDDFEIAEAGTTIEEWLDYLDPRTRYQPQARRIVEQGVARDEDGRPDGTPYLHPFTPEGYEPPQDDGLWIEREITWGHADDGLVNLSLSRVDIGRRPTDIAFHMAHYPLLSLLEAIALRNASTRFEAEESDIPNAVLTVPRFDATLEAGQGMRGLALHVHVRQETAPALFRWLVAEIRALGHEVPPDLLAEAPT